MEAASKRNVDAVNLLISYGADIWMLLINLVIQLYF